MSEPKHTTIPDRPFAGCKCLDCGHDVELHDDLHGCLTDIGPCQCDQCLASYERGERPIWSELCHCGRDDGDDE